MAPVTWGAYIVEDQLAGGQKQDVAASLGDSKAFWTRSTASRGSSRCYAALSIEAGAKGTTTGLYLLLGSASLDLLKQSGETLAGRVSYLELEPFVVLEVGEAAADRDLLWLRDIQVVSLAWLAHMLQRTLREGHFPTPARLPLT
jgi:hypothetical protein